MKLRNKLLLINKLAFLLFLLGIILIFFTWYGVLLELAALLIMIYLSKYNHISLWRIFSYSLIFLSILIFLLYKIHTEKINFLEPDWNLLQSSDKYYFDPLYRQRSLNFNFDSLLSDTGDIKEINLYTIDSEGVPQEAPQK